MTAPRLASSDRPRRAPPGTVRAPVLLALALSACSGGGAASGPGGPAWGEPVTLAERHDLVTGALVGDGAGAVVLLWRQDAVDGQGNGVLEQVGAQLGRDGAWGAPQVLERGGVGEALGPPAAAVDATGAGWMAWLSTQGSPGAETTELRASRITAGASRWHDLVQRAFGFPFGGLSSLRVAVGDDGSARMAWVVPDGGLSFVRSSRLGSGVWEAPETPGGTAGAGMSLAALAGNGLGAYVVEQYRANDQPAGEAVHYPEGGSGTWVAGWEPAAQSGLASHATAWADDGAGGLEAWLVYTSPAAGEPFRQAWPRRRDAAGSWTVAEAVALPYPAEQLAVFREADGSGWLAGAGAAGVWVAPLSGLSLGGAQLLAAAPANATALIGARDAAGRPSLLWSQRRDGASEGIASSQLEGGSWSAPAQLPGTAGVTPQRLHAVGASGGLVATWEQPGDRTTLLRSSIRR